MTYRATFPPGQAYNAQQPSQLPGAEMPQYANGVSQYGNDAYQYTNVVPQYAQSPQQYTGSASAAQQYTNDAYSQLNHNAYYHNQQYNLPSVYSRQTQQQYYAPNTAQRPQLVQPLQPPLSSQPVQQPPQPYQHPQLQPQPQPFRTPRQVQHSLQPRPPIQPPPQRQHHSRPPREVQQSVQLSQLPQPAPYPYGAQPNHHTQQPLGTYDGPYEQTPAAQSEPVVEFVNPSFLQQRNAPAPASRSLPPQPQPASPTIPQHAEPTSMPRQQHIKSVSSMSSPRVEALKTPSQLHKTMSGSGVTKRQGSVHSATRSPSVGHAALPDTLSLFICVAEDCFAKARQSIQQMGRSLHPATLKEYHRLIATGLGCLDMALQSNKLVPRLEARVRLRYASMLLEETTNYAEAETILTKGISVSEKHRLADLKFCMQYLHVKILFQRNPKAAIISLDAHIADCTTYREAHWAYAYLFLKAAFYNQVGAGSERAALENLQKLASMAQARGDRAICVAASLLEGLVHLRSEKSDSILRVQTCIANASKYQLEDAVRLPQLEVLLVLLDLACSIHQKSAQESWTKLTALTQRMDEMKDRAEMDARQFEMLLPIRKQKPSGNSPSHSISPDTTDILREGDGEIDFLVLPTIGVYHTWALAYALHGIVVSNTSSDIDKSSAVWQQAITTLKGTTYKGPPTSLSNAMKGAEAEAELLCYLHILLGLRAAALSEWKEVKKALGAVGQAHAPQGVIQTLHLYLQGAFRQGIGQIDEALAIFEGPQFDLQSWGSAKGGHVEKEVAILAAFNRLWILEHDKYRDSTKIAMLIDQLQPICAEHPDPEIRATYHLVVGTARANPPLSVNQLKQHISRGTHLLKDTQNKQLIAIGLSIMRAKLFGGVVGVQATKSARAAVQQTSASGTVLWQSVAEGMLADTYETDGKVAEARMARGKGIQLANEVAEKVRDAVS